MNHITLIAKMLKSKFVRTVGGQKPVDGDIDMTGYAGVADTISGIKTASGVSLPVADRIVTLPLNGSAGGNLLRNADCPTITTTYAGGTDGRWRTAGGNGSNANWQIISAKNPMGATPVIHATPVGDVFGSDTAIAQDNIPVSVPGRYAIGAWARGAGEAHLQVSTDTHAATIQMTDDWQLLLKEFTLSSGVVSVYAGNVGGGTELYMTSPFLVLVSSSETQSRLAALEEKIGGTN